MARVNCGKCGVSENPKTTATIYWRTRPPGQEFEKWKQRLCRDCFAAEVTPRIRLQSEAPNACAAKGNRHDDQLFDVWATIYTPRQKDGPTWDDSFAVCESHMPGYLELMRAGAEDLDSRGDGAPRLPDPWDDLT